MTRIAFDLDTIGLKQTAGFTLVELLIAMTISVVLIGGVVQMFISSKQAYRLQESQARMQENARFIFDLLSNSIRQTGYSGCNSRRPGSVTNNLNTPGSFLYRFDVAIEGYEALISSWNPALPAGMISPLTGSDILVIRGAVGNGIRVVAPMSSVTDDLQVMDDNDLEQYDIVMVADCISAAIIQITNADPDTTGTLEHLSGSGVPGNTVSNLDKVYRDDAEVMNLATHVFYIGSGVSGLPALFQKVGSNSAEELVEGVEGMQILYGEDIDGDASADRFLTANQVDMNHVISVRISILLQSITDHLTTDAQSYAFNGTSVTPTDHRVRRVFTTTISLRNRIP